MTYSIWTFIPKLNHILVMMIVMVMVMIIKIILMIMKRGGGVVSKFNYCQQSSSCHNASLHTDHYHPRVIIIVKHFIFITVFIIIKINPLPSSSSKCHGHIIVIVIIIIKIFVGKSF